MTALPVSGFRGDGTRTQKPGIAPGFPICIRSSSLPPPKHHLHLQLRHRPAHHADAFHRGGIPAFGQVIVGYLVTGGDQDMVLQGEVPALFPSVPEATPEASVPAAASSSAGGFERYECVEEGNRKFWEVKVEGASYTVRYGRIGTAGQTLVKQLADAAAAQCEMEKVRAKKEEKGYRRV